MRFLTLIALATTIGGIVVLFAGDSLLATPSPEAAVPVSEAPGPDRSMAPIRDESAPSKAYLGGRNLPSHGVALEGYCPVAYVAANKPLRGSPEFQSVHEGVTYYFVSANAKKAFDRDPEKYVPAYGGWCAYGMSKGDKFPVDPLNFKVENGRALLFLKNAGVDARALWNKGDSKKNFEAADANWKKIGG